jgi:RHS repeat-associated protein
MKWCEDRCREYNSPTFVVKSQTVKNGEADNKGHRYEYSYAGALIDKNGYGLLGFRRSSSETALQVNMSAVKLGLKHISYFRQTFPFQGQLETMKMVRVSDGRLLGKTDYEYLVTDPKAGVHTYLVQIKQQTTQHLGTQGNASYSIGKTLIYDDYGNITLLGDLGNIEDPSDDLYKKVIYEKDVANWILGYPVDVRLCPTSACDQVLNHEQHAYDDQRNMLYTRAYDDTNKVWLGSEFSKYDDFGNVRFINDAWWDDSGNKQGTFNPVLIAYESTFNTYPTSQTNALQRVSTSIYDARFGQIKQTTGINGNSVIMDYDGFSRIKVLYGPNPQGDKTLLKQYEYGILNNEMYSKVINTIDWNGATAWDTDYLDALGRTYRKEREATSGTIVQLTCYLSQTTQIKQFSLPYYEVNKGDTCESNSAAYWTEYQYDSLKRPKQITHADKSITQVTYTIQKLDNYNRDYVQRTDSVGLPEQRTITSYLNPENAVLKRIFPNQNSVSQEQAVVNQYDHLGRTKQTVVPGGATTSSVYDSLNRLVSANNSDSGAITQTYYKQNGLLKSVVDASGTTQNYTQYDPILRLKTKQYVKEGETRTIQYTYDASQPDCYNLGTLTAVDDTQGMKHSYCYDAPGNNVYSELDLTNEGVSYTIAAQYDPFGRLTRFTYPDSDYMQRAYNIEGPLNQVNLCDKGSDNCTQYAAWKNFSATGHPANLNYLNGVDSNYTYSPSTGHIKTLNAQTASNNALLNKAYTWNTLGLLTAVEDNLNADYSMTFTPDQAGSIKNAVIGQSSGQLSLDYSYNVAGALTQKGETQYTQYTGQKLISSKTGGKSTSYNYYANAFLKNKTTGNTQWDYTYNGQNRLSSVKKAVDQNSTEAKYVYGYNGNLMKRVDSEDITSYYINKNYDVTVYPNSKTAIYTKTLNSLTNTVASVSSSGVFASQTFSYNPVQPTSKPVVETSTSASANGLSEGTASPSGTVSQESGLQGNGYPVADTALFFHSDQTGSTTLVTDTEGQEVTRVTYLPFGDIYQQLSSGPNDFRAKFAGRELNEDVGLYYFGARFYDPSIGQFIQADNRVLGGPEISASSYNRFAYAGNNPVTYTDPSGHSFGSFMKSLGISAAISLAVFETGGVAYGVLPAIGAGGAYWGGESVNHNSNPLKWNWKSGKTYGGLAAGFAVAEVGTALAIVAPEALPEEAGGIAVFFAGLGAAAVDGFAQNATFAALGGGNTQQVLTAGLEGAAIGAAFHVGSSVTGAIGSRVIRAAAREASEATSFGSELASEGGGVDGFGGCSFVTGTLVHTVSGHTPIEDIALYDQVVAYDETTGESGTFMVTAEFTRTAPDYIVLTVGDDILKTTTEHPFHVVGKGWVEAKELQAGDLLQTKSGAGVDVKQLEYRGEPVTVHNFTVDEVHNYYVSAANLLVHNNRCTSVREAKKAANKGVARKRQKLKKNAPVNKNADTAHSIAFQNHNKTKTFIHGYSGNVGVQRLRVQFNEKFQQYLETFEPAINRRHLASCAEAKVCSQIIDKGANPRSYTIQTFTSNGNPSPPCKNCQSWVYKLFGNVIDK